MENPVPQNQNQGLSVDHVKQLEEFLGTLMANQEIIIEQNQEMLSTNKAKQMWGIIKFVIFALITLGTMFYMPQIISKMTEQVSSAMGIEKGAPIDIEKLLNSTNITSEQRSGMQDILKELRK